MISVLGEKEAMGKLGMRLRFQRLRRNLTQGHIAALIGISEPTYRKIEAGDGSIEFRHVAKALAVFGFDQALGDLIPEMGPKIRLTDLLAPERQRASRSPKR